MCMKRIGTSGIQRVFTVQEVWLHGAYVKHPVYRGSSQSKRYGYTVLITTVFSNCVYQNNTLGDVMQSR